MPKAKITRDMIVDAAFEVTRAMGVENVNARTVAEKLSCSTQPVMYHFSKIEEMKRAVYEEADKYHTEYLMNVAEEKGMMLSIGLNYIRFAIYEPNLFRFLFQSGYVVGNGLIDIVNNDELKPLLEMMGKAMGMTAEQTKDVFVTIAMFAHGYASLIANNSLGFDEKAVERDLERAYKGAVIAVMEETK